MKRRILVVDDKQDVLDFVVPHVERAGYEVIAKTSGLEAIEEFESTTSVIDLIVLDIEMPGMSGLEVLEHIRRKDKQIGVIMLTSHSIPGDNVDDEYKRRALHLGARNYVPKSDIGLLVDYIKNALSSNAVAKYSFKLLRIDKEARRVWIKDADEWQVIRTTLTEFRLLELLVSNAGRVCRYKEILMCLFDEYLPGEISDNDPRIMTHMSNLNKKIGTAKVYIKNVPQIGYRFDASHIGG